MIVLFLNCQKILFVSFYHISRQHDKFFFEVWPIITSNLLCMASTTTNEFDIFSLIATCKDAAIAAGDAIVTIFNKNNGKVNWQDKATPNKDVKNATNNENNNTTNKQNQNQTSDDEPPIAKLRRRRSSLLRDVNALYKLDPRTYADEQANHTIVGSLKKHFPNCIIKSEEDADDSNDSNDINAQTSQDNSEVSFVNDGLILQEPTISLMMNKIGTKYENENENDDKDDNIINMNQNSSKGNMTQDNGNGIGFGNTSDDEIIELEDDGMINILNTVNENEDWYKEIRKIKSKDIVIWIDPMDGTKAYIKGEKTAVTVLIGIANNINGECIAGIIHRPFTNHTVIGIVGYGLITFGYQLNLNNEIDEKGMYICMLLIVSVCCMLSVWIV